MVSFIDGIFSRTGVSTTIGSSDGVGVASGDEAIGSGDSVGVAIGSGVFEKIE